MEINKAVDRSHSNAMQKGFYERDTVEAGLVDESLAKLMECIGELCVVAEIIRKEGFEGLDESANDLLDFELKNIGEADIFTLARLMLIITEVAEAADEARAGNSEKFEEEIADICIRVFDLAGSRKINLAKRIIDKMEKNEKRPRMHGKKA